MTILNTKCGFFAEFTQVIRKLSNYNKNQDNNLYVNWDKSSLYYDENYGENVWEYYFQNFSNESDNITYKEYIELKLIEDKNFRETFNLLYNKYIKLKPNVVSELEKYSVFFNNRVLGLHIRRTDKFQALSFNEPMSYPVNNELYIKHINEIINEFDFIYLSTDCKHSYDMIYDIYSDKIIKTNRYMSDDNKPIHSDNKHISGYKKGLDVLIDMLCLSKCEYLIRSTSNVSSTSMFLNLNLKCLNLNEIYMNDYREYDFNIKSEYYV